MSVYNQFLPPGAPLQLLGGEADLSAEIRLEPEDAEGYVRLKTSRLQSRLDEQTVSGLLDLDIKLQDGVPKDMSFDISGSSLSLNGFQVTGDETNFDQPDWQARFDLNKASAVWKKPVQLQLEAGLSMQDTRPIVAMFANQRGKHGWLEKLLTVEDVKGKVKVDIKSGRLLVPYAVAGSDKIDIGAKTLIEKDHREGIVYARYRKLKGILKIKNGEPEFRHSRC